MSDSEDDTNESYYGHLWKKVIVVRYEGKNAKIKVYRFGVTLSLPKPAESFSNREVKSRGNSRHRS